MFRTNTLNEGAFTDPWPARPPGGKVESGYKGTHLLSKQVQKCYRHGGGGGEDLKNGRKIQYR